MGWVAWHSWNISHSLPPSFSFLFSLSSFSNFPYVMLEQKCSLGVAEFLIYWLASSRASTNIGSCETSNDLFLENPWCHFFIKFMLFSFIMCMHHCVGVCELRHSWRQTLNAKVLDHCYWKPLSMGAGKHTRVFWESSKCSFNHRATTVAP